MCKPRLSHANPQNPHSPPASGFLCYMALTRQPTETPAVPRLLVLCAICALWLSHANPLNPRTLRRGASRDLLPMYFSCTPAFSFKRTNGEDQATTEYTSKQASDPAVPLVPRTGIFLGPSKSGKSVALISWILEQYRGVFERIYDEETVPGPDNNRRLRR